MWLLIRLFANFCYSYSMKHLLSSLLLVFLAGYFGFQVSARQLSAESGAERASKRRTNCGEYGILETFWRGMADCYRYLPQTVWRHKWKALIGWISRQFGPASVLAAYPARQSGARNPGWSVDREFPRDEKLATRSLTRLTQKTLKDFFVFFFLFFLKWSENGSNSSLRSPIMGPTSNIKKTWSGFRS